MASEYLESLKQSGKYNQHMADKSRLDGFKRFLKDQDIAFADLTPGLLEKFMVYLRSAHKGKKDKKPLSERSVVNHLVVIRSVFAYARRNKIVKKEQSHFGGDDGIKIKFPESKKVGIGPEEVTALENVHAVFILLRRDACIRCIPLEMVGFSKLPLALFNEQK